jgi:hypothetical protein
MYYLLGGGGVSQTSLRGRIKYFKKKTKRETDNMYNGLENSLWFKYLIYLRDGVATTMRDLVGLSL